MWAEIFIIPLVILSDGESVNVGSFTVVKILRLLRLCRMARVVRVVPQLMTLLTGMNAAFQSVVAVGGLIFALIYGWAVLFKLTYQCCCQEQIEEEVFDFTEFVNAACATKATAEAAGETFVCHGACGNFDTLSMAIWTLVHVCLTGEGINGLFVWDAHWMKLALLIYLVLANVMVFQMLIGFLVTIVESVSKHQNDQQLLKRAKETLEEHFMSGDTNQSGLLDLKEFYLMCSRKDVIEALEKLEIDVYHWISSAEYIFDGQPTISFGVFLENAIKLRSNRASSVQDNIDVRKAIFTEMESIEERNMRNHETILAHLAHMQAQLDVLTGVQTTEEKTGQGLIDRAKAAEHGLVDRAKNYLPSAAKERSGRSRKKDKEDKEPSSPRSPRANGSDGWPEQS
jgi:uncharacterized membrane protein